MTTRLAPVRHLSVQVWQASRPQMLIRLVQVDMYTSCQAASASIRDAEAAPVPRDNVAAYQTPAKLYGHRIRGCLCVGLYRFGLDKKKV